MKVRSKFGMLALAAALAAPLTAWAQTLPATMFDPIRMSPQVRGLAARFTIVGIQEGDLDGDGQRESVIAFAPSKSDRERGGFAIVGVRAGKPRTLWSGIYEEAAPESFTVEGDRIRTQVKTPKGRVRVSLVHGRDFKLRGAVDETFPVKEILTSLRKKSMKPALKTLGQIADGDPESVWVVGSGGTGVGEWVQIEFARPVDLGLVGVIGGDARGDKEWRDANRLFRYDLVLETQEDRTTVVENLDLSSMLNLPTIGRRFSVKANDMRRMKWAEVGVRKVVSIKLEVVSVYLGDAQDELALSELEFAALLPPPSEEPPLLQASPQ